MSEWFDAVTERRKNPDMYPVDDIEGPTMKNEYLEELMGGGENGN